MSNVKILAFAGSLRKDSFNKKLLKQAEGSLPKDTEYRIYDIAEIPLYNGDLEQNGFPEPVERFRQAIASADALLIATPEYNYSVPGVLNNAIDWASRPPQPPLAAKPTAVIGATPSGFGTVRAQLALKQIASGPGMQILPKPELLISAAHQKFDADGTLNDPIAQQGLTDVLQALADYTRKLRG